MSSRPLGALRPLLLAPLLLTGCSSLHIATDWDRGVDFAPFRTFEFAASPEDDGGGPAVSNRVFLDRRIRRAVTADLTAKGLRPVDPGRGDLIVVYWLHLRDVVDVYSYGYYPGGGSYARYKEGTLVLDFVDRERDEVVWRGWAEGIRAEVRHSEEQMFDITRKILHGFPPIPEK